MDDFTKVSTRIVSSRQTYVCQYIFVKKKLFIRTVNQVISAQILRFFGTLPGLLRRIKSARLENAALKIKNMVCIRTDA